MHMHEVSKILRNVSLSCYQLQVGHNPSALDFLADVANSAGNHVAGETSRGTAAAAVSAGVHPINGILKVRQNCYSWLNMFALEACKFHNYRLLYPAAATQLSCFAEHGNLCSRLLMVNPGKDSMEALQAPL